MLRADTVCEVSGEALGDWFPSLEAPGEVYSKWKWARAVDHIIPERWARKFIKGCDPHVMENLVVITSSLHGKKWPIEKRAYSADWVGYCQGLRALGFNQTIIDRALKALNASVQK